MKAIFEVPDVEHQGDIDHFTGIIKDAGGEILKVNWSGDDGDSCYIFYRCSSREELEKVKSAMEEFL